MTKTDAGTMEFDFIENIVGKRENSQLQQFLLSQPQGYRTRVHLVKVQEIYNCISFLIKCTFMFVYNYCYMFIALNYLDYIIFILFKLIVSANDK